jgi:5-methylcytosine-specific restriction endonuclease McrA
MATEDCSVKYCGGCKQTKPASDFSKSATQCKACYSAYHAARYKNDSAYAERKRAIKKAWYAKKQEYAKQYSRDWNAKNIERKRKAGRAWYRANAESVKATVRAWCKDNPEHANALYRARRARQRNALGMHTAEDVLRLYELQQGKCACCRKQLNKQYHVDHIIPLIKGGTNDVLNLQLLCISCNTSKSDRDPLEFMQSKGFLL